MQFDGCVGNGLIEVAWSLVNAVCTEQIVKLQVWTDGYSYTLQTLFAVSIDASASMSIWHTSKWPLQDAQ